MLMEVHTHMTREVCIHLAYLVKQLIEESVDDGFIRLVCQHVCVVYSVYLNLGLNRSSYEESGDLVYKSVQGLWGHL